MGVPDNEVKVEGTTKIYDDRKTDSGKQLHRVFCENCGRYGGSQFPFLERILSDDANGGFVQSNIFEGGDVSGNDM